jgi:putative holliday junction resolvase
MSFLGLDYGEKRVGVAKSDELNCMAHSCGYIARKSDEQVVLEIKSIAENEKVEGIVIGLPVTMKGTIGTQAKLVISFIDRLKSRVSIDVVTWDERLTTAEAEKALLGQDMSRAKRRARRDAIAAEIMLQSYLDYLKNHK